MPLSFSVSESKKNLPCVGDFTGLFGVRFVAVGIVVVRRFDNLEVTEKRVVVKQGNGDYGSDTSE